LKFWVGPPDLAVETMSPSDTVFEVDEKVQEWLTAGTRLVWVLNPRQKTVTVYRPDNTAQILGGGDTLDGADVVPGFTIAVAELFV
jgi:Uma2 family endonuclease